jgi:hypothetical protein
MAGRMAAIRSGIVSSERMSFSESNRGISAP